KSGIIETDNGYELVWGIGDYGTHEYYVVYTVTDFIKQLEDKQILFWRFVNDEMNVPPENLWIQIEMDRPITNETEKIWAFGFEGDIQFDNGKVVAQSEKAFDESNYGTVLIQFPQDTFQTNDILDKSFAEIEEEAFEGSDYGGRSELKFVQDVLPYITIGFVFLAPALIGYFFLFRKFFQKQKSIQDRFKKYEDEYYRDIPSDEHFLDLFFLLENGHLTSYNKTIHALLLKWLAEDNISMRVIGTTKWRKKEIKAIYFHPTDDIANEYEDRLFNLLIQLKGPNKAVPLNQTDVWTKKLQEEFAEWAEDLLENTKVALIERHYLEKEMVEKFSGPEDEYHVIGEGKELQRKVYGFINYMTDFSLMDEHDADNVKLWQQVMVWLASFGLTAEVIIQFEKINSEYVPSSLYDKDTIDTSNKFTTSTILSNYTSGGGGIYGGGGSCSIGGGGGSFGGGSGGGTR